MVVKLNMDDMFENGLFPHHINLGDNVKAVRNAINNFKLDSLGIDILTFQAGVGKTYHTNEILKSIKSYLLVTGSHKLLKGEYSALKATKHWKNFPEKCQEYKSQVQRLDLLGVSKRYNCQIKGCDKRRCPYWKQFNTNKAIAPFHYLSTDRVLNQEGKFKFDMLLVDEAMDYGTDYILEEESLAESIQAIGKYEDVRFFEEINWDEDLFDYLQENFNLLNNKRYSALNSAINEKQWDDVKEIAKFRPYNLIRYYYYHHIYGNSSIYFEPLLFTVFDLARQQIPIIMLDASFDLKAYEVTLARYNFEHKQLTRDIFSENPLGPIADLSTTIYQSNIRDKHKTIHRMDKNNLYFKKGFFNNNKLTETGKKTILELKKFIRRTKRKNNHIGIITYLDLEPYFKGLGETEHFFNLRGSNKFEDVEVLFIIGTPQKAVSDILDGYNNLCLTKLTTKSIYKPTYILKDGKNCLHHEYEDDNGKHELWDCNDDIGYEEKKPASYRFKGDYEDWYHDQFRKQHDEGEIDLDLWYNFSDYSMNQDESEKYQAIHRARPFNKDNPIIYIFGDVPEKIKEEFNVDYHSKDATRIHFMGNRPDNMGVYPFALWRAITNYFSKTGATSEEIAKKLRLYKKDKKSYNTKFITTILEGINIKDIQRIDKFLKAETNVTINQIKRNYRSLKIDDDMIDYFIFYAQEGAFINL